MLKFMAAKVIENRVENGIVKKLLVLLTVGTQLKRHILGPTEHNVVRNVVLLLSWTRKYQCESIILTLNPRHQSHL